VRQTDYNDAQSDCRTIDGRDGSDATKKAGFGMRTHSWLRAAFLTLAIYLALAISPQVDVALAQSGPPVDDAELARRFSPVLYFHPAEVFRPQTVDVMLSTARLRRQRRNWFDANVLTHVTAAELSAYQDPGYALDVWYGNDGASEYSNYSAHRAYYQAALSPQVAGPPATTYAHVARDEDPAHITIQYWLFYYYNDAFNKHEGDWEMAEVVLGANGDPEWLVLSQHHGGTRRPWGAVQVEGGTHPAVYVALGSHANYFWGDEAYAQGMTIGNVKLQIMDRTGKHGRTAPQVILIPDRAELEADPASWSGLSWLLYGGRWGEPAPQNDFSGPYGPAYKGEQWERPYAWGMAQPLDLGAWYANRLRVAVMGEAAEGARVTLKAANGQPLPPVDASGDVAILHADPPLGAVIVAEIQALPGRPATIAAVWPDAGASQVTWYQFQDVPPNASGRFSLTLQADRPPALSVAGSPLNVEPTTVEPKAVTWDVPDPVWLAGMLPASDVVRGAVIALLAGMLPALLYVGLLYWADRYEKEPKAMLAAAFFWGAVPAVLVAVAARLFFRLPAGLIGPQAVEAVRAGAVAPLIEEAIKGVAIVIVATRYRLEFDDLLDGIVYGAVVGFGFAMTGNTLSYLGAFALRGFAGLSNTIFAQGLLYGLDHALYSAVFGAGLGWARLAQTRRRWLVPLAAFLLAVLVHVGHNLLLRHAVGVSPLTAVTTWAGALAIVAVMAWSLRRQRQWMALELAGEVPDDVYRALTTLGGQGRAQWWALRREGLGGWQRAKQMHRQCAELALKKMQHERRPGELGLSEEIDRLRKALSVAADR
jgi:RsiW-degrading membrane proteinase PrsW (M82 family)